MRARVFPTVILLLGAALAAGADGGLQEENGWPQWGQEQGGGLRSHLFLNLAIGAAYTPVAIGRDGRIYSENFGTLFVVGR